MEVIIKLLVPVLLKIKIRFVVIYGNVELFFWCVLSRGQVVHMFFFL